MHISPQHSERPTFPPRQGRKLFTPEVGARTRTGRPFIARISAAASTTAQSMLNSTSGLSRRFSRSLRADGEAPPRRNQRRQFERECRRRHHAIRGGRGVHDATRVPFRPFARPGIVISRLLFHLVRGRAPPPSRLCGSPAGIRRISIAAPSRAATTSGGTWSDPVPSGRSKFAAD